MRVVVTGARGFLGGAVVAALLRRGHMVRALIRPASQIDNLVWASRVEIVRADLRSRGSLASAFEGADVLVHLAARVGGGDGAQMADTVVGTERLLEAMAGSTTRRLVLASSFSVYDWSAIRWHSDRGITAGVRSLPPRRLRDRQDLARASHSPHESKA